MPASSAASSALSTASLTQVRSAFRGLSKPSKWRFLVKNSETEMSRWRAPISAADRAAFGSAVGALASTVDISFLDTKPAPTITLLYSRVQRLSSSRDAAECRQDGSAAMRPPCALGNTARDKRTVDQADFEGAEGSTVSARPADITASADR